MLTDLCCNVYFTQEKADSPRRSLQRDDSPRAPPTTSPKSAKEPEGATREKSVEDLERELEQELDNVNLDDDNMDLADINFDE